MTGIKVKNSSDYWRTYEGDSAIYWYIIWQDKASYNQALINKEAFYIRYIKIANKYQFFLPAIEYFKEELGIKDIIKDFLLLDDSSYLHKSALSVGALYMDNLKTKTKLFHSGIYPCLLFVYDDEGNIKNDIITDLKHLTSIKNSIGQEDMGSRIRDDIGSLMLRIDTDAFFPIIINSKTIASENKEIKKRGVDNSELAYLNTPRLNSFIRDLTQLCFDYGADKIEFENSFDEIGEEKYATSNGILFNGEVIYYEDVEELLAAKYRIVKKQK